jgi:hypothetical protein
VLEEEQAPARPQNAPHLGQRPFLVDAAQHERRDDGVEARVLERQCLGGSVIVNLMVQYSRPVDNAFVALADPTRRAVLERLVSGSASISELAEPFGMSLTGMKKHIRLLEEADLVTTEKVGGARTCPTPSRESARGYSGSTASPR